MMHPTEWSTEAMLKATIACGLLVCTAAAANEDAIRENFEAYRSALSRGDGQEAFSLVNARTRDYYEALLERTRYATREECAELPVLDKLAILLGRVQMSKANLKSFDAEDYFRYAVDKAWINQIPGNVVEISDIQIEGDSAEVQVTSDGQPTPFPYVFTKESGGWKLDLTTLLETGEATLRQKIERVELSEEEFLFEIVEATVGTRPTAATWDPPLRQKG